MADTVKRKRLTGVLRSPALLIAASLLIGTICVLLISPDSLDAADGVPAKYKVLVSKLSSFLTSNENPDAVIIGSSLVLMPAVRCDDRLSGKLDCYDDWYYYQHIPEYTRASYMEHLLHKAGLPVSIKNLGVASSIMSDHAGVLETILAEGKKPGLVICGIAPRDFLDNSQQIFENTPTQLFLKEYHSSGKLWPASFSQADLQQWYELNDHQIRKFFARVRTTCSNFVCEVTEHPANLQHTKTKETAYLESRPNLLKDLQSYQKLYNPPNYKMLEQQKGFLEKFLTLAQKNNVEVLLINMPLTRENTRALDPAVHDKYLETIATVARAHKVTLLNIGSRSPNYSVADFEDCCHLNAAGGQKLYAAVFDTLVKNQRLSSSLSQRANNHIADSKSGRVTPATPL